MKTVATINYIIFILTAGLMVGWGFDLKKWTSWMLGVYAFLSFMLLGLSNAGSIGVTIKLSLFFAILILFGGAVMHWSREQSEKWLKQHNKE